MQWSLFRCLCGLCFGTLRCVSSRPGGVVIFQVFFYTIVDKACSAPDVVLVDVILCEISKLQAGPTV